MEAVRGHLLLTNCLEDVREFHQRPKIEDYDDFVSIVVYGARDLDEKLLEVHCFYAEHFFVSVHRHPAAAVGDACATLGRLHTDRRLVAVYRLLDALVDSMFPYLSALDDRIDELQDQIFESPRESQLAALFELKRQLVHLRKVVTPGGPYPRDDAYMSMVSNRLNDVMKQLTIIATVFLPLSFLTGFFGQNLGWMADRVGSLTAFLVFGIGTEVLAVIALFVMFRRRGWMGKKS
jgi:magnesium transporter